MATTPQGHDCTVIELPYQGNGISMVIVVPNGEDTPLSSIIPHVNTTTVKNWTKVLRMMKVHLAIPK